MMNRRPSAPRSGCWSTAGGVLLASILVVPALAQDQELAPLARYVPAEELAVLIEHDGLATRPGVWEATATARMLKETPLGAMLADVAVQLLDRALAGIPGRPATGKDVLAILDHLARRGFVVGYCGSLNPPQPKAVVLVIREAADNPVFKKLIALVPPLNEPAAKKIEQPGGRTVFILDEAPVRWWYEKGDAVFSFAPPGGPDPVADTLDGKSPSAVNHPARVALAKAEPGDVPVGRLFVDLAALPALPAQASDMGLDTIKRVDARWSIRGKAISTMLAVQAPRPRQGVLALLDQPPIAPGTAVSLPQGQTDFTLLAFNPIKTGDAILAMMKPGDPESVAALAQSADRFRQQSGLSLRNDLLGKLGPRVAIAAPGGGSSLGLLGLWFTPPDFGAVIEVKDPAKFATNLDCLMDYVNRELKTLGSMVPSPPGDQAIRAGARFAEFRRLKGPERGYVLAVPPGVLPTPAGLKPTVLVDPARGLLALGGTPDSARRALSSLVLAGPVVVADRPGEFLRVQSDPTGSLPQLLASIPSLVQIVAISAAQSRGPAGRQPMGPPFRLELDPDAIPEAGVLRPYLFPSKFAMAADDASIRLTLDAAFPLPIPSISTGIEAPVLIALLLPAVQAAREAARRSQCVNNLKQIGLAMHNHHAANETFPTAAILDKEGKPLLSWRVAILPYLDQQTLYEKFKLDEPWDSPNNKELIKLMPAVYACPSRGSTDEAGLTTYRIFSSPGALFDATQPAPTLADVTDGTSNTLMVVEAGETVPWTKPEGLTSGQPGVPLSGAGSRHPGGFNALFADGSVHFLKATVNLQVFEALISRAGGEVISADSY